MTGAPPGATRARRRDFPLRRRALARGAPDRIRTCGLLLRRQTLYPLSYRGPRPDFTSAGPADRNRAAAPIAVSSVTPRPRRCARRRAAPSGQVLITWWRFPRGLSAVGAGPWTSSRTGSLLCTRPSSHPSRPPRLSRRGCGWAGDGRDGGSKRWPARIFHPPSRAPRVPKWRNDAIPRERRSSRAPES